MSNSESALPEKPLSSTDEMPSLPKEDGFDDEWTTLPWLFMDNVEAYGKACYEAGIKKGKGNE